MRKVQNQKTSLSIIYFIPPTPQLNYSPLHLVALDFRNTIKQQTRKKIFVLYIAI
jgi:hypothetical protein